MKYVEPRRLLLGGIPWPFTTYYINDEMLTVKDGILVRFENDCFLYKIVDVKLGVSIFERLFGLGTVICYTGDVTDPKIFLRHIKNAKEIKDFIASQSEKERIAKRTINTFDLDSNYDL